ncbi:hypothetical protein ACHAWF_012166 [Thalassiosira exigua]
MCKCLDRMVAPELVGWTAEERWFGEIRVDHTKAVCTLANVAVTWYDNVSVLPLRNLDDRGERSVRSCSKGQRALGVAVVRGNTKVL